MFFYVDIRIRNEKEAGGESHPGDELFCSKPHRQNILYRLWVYADLCAYM